MTARRASGLLLAIDTATARVVLALGADDGTLLAADTWTAGHRHVEELLPRLEALLQDQGLDRAALAVAFGMPLAAVGTGVALLAAAEAADPTIPAERLVLLLPAGPGGRYLVTRTGTRLVTEADPLDLPADAVIVAVDLPGRAPDLALARGEAALDQLPGILLRLGAAKLCAGTADDPAGVVPEYVSLPRGAKAAPFAEAVTPWSPGHR